MQVVSWLTVFYFHFYYTFHGYGAFYYRSNIVRLSRVPSTILPVDSEKAHRTMSSGRYFSPRAEA